MGAKEFKASFKRILFNKGRVSNETKWKLEKIIMAQVWYFYFSVLATMYLICDC